MIQLITFISLFLTTSAHELHLSKTEVNYKSDQMALQMTVHLFIDDLELGLSKYSDEKLRLFDKKESPKSDSLISLFINEHLNISLDNNKISPEYLGKEISDDLAGAWCYLELENVEPFEVMNIKNELLTSTFEDQKNIITIKVDSKSKAFHILNKDDNYKVIKI